MTRLWRRIRSEPDARRRLMAACVRGYLDLLRRWRVDAQLGARPTTFKHNDDHVVIEVVGIEVGSVASTS